MPVAYAGLVCGSPATGAACNRGSQNASDDVQSPRRARRSEFLTPHLGIFRPGVLDCGSIQLIAKTLAVLPNAIFRRPVLRLVRGQSSLNRVDSKTQKLVELRMERREAKRFAQKVPSQRLRGAPGKKLISVAFRDGAIIKRAGMNNPEKFLAAGSCRLKASKKLIGVGRLFGCSRGHRSPVCLDVFAAGWIHRRSIMPTAFIIRFPQIGSQYMISGRAKVMIQGPEALRRDVAN